MYSFLVCSLCVLISQLVVCVYIDRVKFLGKKPYAHVIVHKYYYDVIFFF